MGLLTKKDKAELIEMMTVIVQTELKALVMREAIMEKGPREQGDPAEKVVEKMTINVIDEIAKYMPYLEGAVRGMQADVNTNTNIVDSLNNQVGSMGSALLAFQAPVIKLARLQAAEHGALPQANLTLLDNDE